MKKKKNSEFKAKLGNTLSVQKRILCRALKNTAHNRPEFLTGHGMIWLDHTTVLGRY
jgi:hypothetical protein